MVLQGDPSLNASEAADTARSTSACTRKKFMKSHKTLVLRKGEINQKQVCTVHGEGGGDVSMGYAEELKFKRTDRATKRNCGARNKISRHTLTTPGKVSQCPLCA